LRALVTWTFLAGFSAWLLESSYRGWIDLVTRRLSITMQALAGYTPPATILEMSSVFAVMSWFQPICLRLNIFRSALWILIYVVVGLAIYAMYFQFPNRFDEAAFDALLLTPMFGLPGLVTVGVRTRPWMSPGGAILSMIVVYVFWDPHGSLAPAALLANIPYAALMLYGTRPVRKTLLP
jgi:hypothetical protein